jgi:hypothetical protein
MSDYTRLSLDESALLSLLRDRLARERCYPLLLAGREGALGPYISLFAELAKEHRLMPFSGKRTYFECRVPCPSEEDSDAGLQVLRGTLLSARRLDNFYRGIAALDISDWGECLEGKRFARLVRELDKYPGAAFVFTLYTRDAEVVRRAEHELGKHGEAPVWAHPEWTPAASARRIGFADAGCDDERGDGERQL